VLRRFWQHPKNAAAFIGRTQHPAARAISSSQWDGEDWDASPEMWLKETALFSTPPHGTLSWLRQAGPLRLGFAITAKPELLMRASAPPWPHLVSCFSAAIATDKTSHLRAVL
jgi:hypothetical protein